MWTQSEAAHQTTHNGNNTTIESKTIKRFDAFDEEKGEKRLIFPLIMEVGTLILYLVCYEYKILSDRIYYLRSFSYNSYCIIKDNHPQKAIRRESK